jgi:hypothetical protein
MAPCPARCPAPSCSDTTTFVAIPGGGDLRPRNASPVAPRSRVGITLGSSCVILVFASPKKKKDKLEPGIHCGHVKGARACNHTPPRSATKWGFPSSDHVASALLPSSPGTQRTDAFFLRGAHSLCDDSFQKGEDSPRNSKACDRAQRANLGTRRPLGFDLAAHRRRGRPLVGTTSPPLTHLAISRNESDIGRWSHGLPRL